MNRVYDGKVDFTERLLRPLVMATDPAIVDVRYSAHQNSDGYLYNELVIITYRNGYEIKVNVGADSYLAMTRDTLKELPT